MKNRTTRHLSIYYFFVFCGIGGVFPLLSVYFDQELHLSGTEIGTIMSIGPVITLLLQPIWGLICDYTRKPKTVLTATLILTGLVGMLYLLANDYLWLLFIAGFLAVFQSAIIPISDSISVSYTQKIRADYGSIRLWGALGFAFSAFFMGKISEWTGLKVIFICLAFSLLTGALLVRKMPDSGGEFQVDLRSGLRDLMKIPKFVLFIFATFLIFGPVQGNNVYFGLLIGQLGGSIVGIGAAFLVAAGTEAPFMRLCGPWIRKRGFLLVTLLAALVSCLRWFFYFLEPDVMLVYVSTIAQGFSVGLFIPAALSYVKHISPDEVTATAVSLYSAAGTGLGNWFCVFFGGLLLDAFNISAVYLFYGVMTFAGVCLLGVIMKMEKRETIVGRAEAL
ncbi:PPP family 3-phenylpropionic acid transporter [Scopulibacillus darangshiensis]|uniref:PPP family 3-phenylpropionic acid transporter n=1 Tax=Scopulibacillus darangshiensis TaxID=442528 RepID=A0A4R2NX96_9BACL|nr:PPP family 3-phenylpropionic acid transporter [Scopulibacillus darangshiensis]